MLVIGAGVLGLCTAVALTRRGRKVVVLDPGGGNASSVAAGMIAPGIEAFVDGASPEHARLLREAGRLWADIPEVRLKPAPAVWRGKDGERTVAALEALGFEASLDDQGQVQVPEDVQVDPVSALAALKAVLRPPPVEALAVRIDRTATGWVVETDAGPIEAKTVVLATGAAEPLPGLPETVAALVRQIAPIRGQIGFTAQSLAETVTRGAGGYVAPTEGGTLIGATMEPGRRDLEPDAEVGARLATMAAALIECEIEDGVYWRVGVRGATPDGLPMAGFSGEEGLYLALAPRRNGWLLGPMVGRVVADAVEGGDTLEHAAALNPLRFA
ncbi:MAG: FAD-binding oxidoreductase [Caulobacteraceae bacterium]|nr:FAD-binding oxidoreductase [Caulobacteraceae bacterium]